MSFSRMTNCYKCGAEYLYRGGAEVLCNNCVDIVINDLYKKYNIYPGDTVYTLVKTRCNNKDIYEVREYTLNRIRFINVFRFREEHKFNNYIEDKIEIILDVPNNKSALKRFSFKEIYTSKDMCIEANKRLLLSKIIDMKAHTIIEGIKDALYANVDKIDDPQLIKDIVNRYSDKISTELKIY